MRRQNALTVRQSMAVIFACGAAAALLFGASAIGDKWAARAALLGDRALVAQTRQAAAIVRALQRERALGAALLAGPPGTPDDRVAGPRGRTDAVLAALPAGAAAAAIEAGPPRGRSDGAGGTPPRGDRDATGARIAALIDAVARDADRAASARVALQMQRLAMLMATTEATGREAAVGAGIAARRAAGRTVDPRDLLELARQRTIAETWLGALRAAADDEAAERLDLWARSPARTRLERARSALAADASGAAPERPSPAGWLARADAAVAALGAVEAAAMDRLGATLDGEIAGTTREIGRDALLLAVLIAAFGIFAYATTRELDRSIRRLVRSVCRMCVDIENAQVHACRQPDLRQLSDALRILRKTHIRQRDAIEATEQVPENMDRQMTALCDAASVGRTDRRLDVLGLDGNAAALARGVNRLLDQLERQGGARTS